MKFIYVECALSCCSRFNNRFLKSKWRISLLLLFTVFCLWIQFYLVFCAKLFENSALRILNFSIYCLENYLPLPWEYFYSINMLLFDWINSLNPIKISLGQFSGGHLELRLNAFYNGVETFSTLEVILVSSGQSWMLT